jgi:hypothetical protein
MLSPQRQGEAEIAAEHIQKQKSHPVQVQNAILYHLTTKNT